METTNKSSNSNVSNQYINSQVQYYLEGDSVSREDFYKYGFRHEKVEEPRSIDTTT